MKTIKPIFKWIILIITVVALLGAITLIIVIINNNQYITINNADTFRQWNNKIIYHGQHYKKNKDISAVLFLGVDHADGLDDAIYLGRGGRTDTIYVFLLNKKEKTTTLLSISRDTMTEVDVYNPEGRYYYSGVMQVTMQYAYGNSDEKSTQLAKKTISELLYDLDFDAYISVNLEAITKVIDMLGGLTITMPEDYSYINPRYTEGATLTLSSWEVEWLLRYRDKSQLESNDDRMRRQTILLETAVKELKNRGILSMIPDLLQLAKEDITTNAGLSTIKKLASYDIAEERYSVPGENRAGEIHAEFYVDQDELMDMLVELFYIREE